MQRVLITGAGGFIGAHLVADQLKRGREVTAVDIHVQALEPLRANDKLHIVNSSFVEPAFLDGLQAHDACFHLASAHLETGVDADYFWKVNVQGARQFVERCRAAGIKRFVHCSSVGVYGDIDNPPADEETECKPDIAYEESKLAGEKAVLQFAKESGYEVVIVRPAWVYGPGCPRTAKLFRTIKKGRFFFVGDGQTLRHPIYIDDMVSAFEIAATSEHAPGEVYIIAGPRAVTLRELSGEIARCLGIEPPKMTVPKTVAWAGCLMLEAMGTMLKRDVPFTRRSLKFFTGNTAFTTDKARTKLGYAAHTDLSEGLQRTYQWLQHENAR